VFIQKTHQDLKMLISLSIEAKENNMEIKNWELSFGLFEGLLLGYRNYPDMDNAKVDHVFYLFIIDICLTLKY
jgi:hypothetical protein